MTANDFRAALRTRTAAFFLGAAVIAGTGIALSVPAEAAVRAVVGKPLQEAQSMPRPATTPARWPRCIRPKAPAV